MRRTALLLAATALAVVPLAGCGSSSSSSESSSPGLSPAVAWADTVCQRGTDLKASIDALGSSISVDPGTDGTALDQIKGQLSSQVETIKSDVADLASALAAVPKDADPGVQEEAQTLTEAKASVDSSVQTLQADIDTFSSADGVANKVLAFKQVVTQAGVVKSDLAAFRTAVKSTASAANEATKQAFADAPSCAAFTSSS